MKNKGWIVWTWGKLGSLLVFTGMMILLLTTLVFVNGSLQVKSANSASFAIRDAITDTYNSVGDMSLDYELPRSLNGEDYSMEILDKPGDTIGVITKTIAGQREISGGASITVPLADESFGILKDYFDSETDLCIIKFEGKIYLEKSKCS